VVLDPYDQTADDQSELHVNPLDGPEAFLTPWPASCNATTIIGRKLAERLLDKDC